MLFQQCVSLFRFSLINAYKTGQILIGCRFFSVSAAQKLVIITRECFNLMHSFDLLEQNEKKS